jgi:D-arabinose 1-dehydrogenase-like Zn-dependent alcohol dehydrogenase
MFLRSSQRCRKDLGFVEPPAIMKRRQLAGSTIGGIRKAQEMLDFCSERGITADIELIKIQQINEAYERLLKSDVSVSCQGMVSDLLEARQYNDTLLS